jgi:probable HAF family extracellular repeat protein
MAASTLDPAAGKARRFFVTDLGTLGGTESFAYAINDLGQITGHSRTAGDASTHAFLYRNGTMVDLYPLDSGEIRTGAPMRINNSGQIASGVVVDGIYYPAVWDVTTQKLSLLGSLGGVTPDGFSGVASAISNVGDVVGYAYLDASNRHAFLYFNGKLTDIGSLGGYSAALDVNDSGTIVGFSSTASSEGRAHAFVYANGVMVDIDPSGNLSESYAMGVNSKGEVVGQFLAPDQGSTRAFVYRDGGFHDIGADRSPETVAFSINDRSEIVGTTLVPKLEFCPDNAPGEHAICIRYISHAFLYADGRFANLNALISPRSGWELQWAFDVNNRGEIVGYGLHGEVMRAFLLTPVLSHKQCMSGAWRRFGFRNLGQCIRYVATGI